MPQTSAAAAGLIPAIGMTLGALSAVEISEPVRVVLPAIGGLPSGVGSSRPCYAVTQSALSVDDGAVAT